MMFCGFRSRWITPRSCAAARPAQSLRAVSSALSAGRRPMRVSSDARSSPSTYSMEMNGIPSTSPMSYTRQTFGCETCRATRTSPWKRSSRRSDSPLPPPAGTSAQPTGRASGPWRDTPRPCRRGPVGDDAVAAAEQCAGNEPSLHPRMDVAAMRGAVALLGKATVSAAVASWLRSITTDSTDLAPPSWSNLNLMRYRLAVLLCAGVGVAYGQWTIQSSGTQASLRGISAVNARVAWAGGTQSTLLRTVDGGKTWIALPAPASESLDFRDIEAFDEQSAIATSAGPGAQSRLYRTTDGGSHWTPLFQNKDEAGFFDAIAFWDRMLLGVGRCRGWTHGGAPHGGRRIHLGACVARWDACRAGGRRRIRG